MPEYLEGIIAKCIFFICNCVLLQAAVVSEGVARWEDNKKWQQKVETLRGKLAEKAREQEKAEKTITMLREAVNRAEKDKAGLHSRLKRCAMFISVDVASKFLHSQWRNRYIFLYLLAPSKVGLVNRHLPLTKLYRTLNTVYSS